MPEKSEPKLTSGLAINLISNLVATVVGAVVTYLQHEGSAWVKPLLFGGAAWITTFCSILAVRIMRRIPKRADPITQENVGRRIREWFDEFGLTVRTVHEPDSSFGYVVTTDGGKRIAVSKNKTGQFSDYIQVQASINPTDEEKQNIAKLSEDEKTAIGLAIKLELSRAVMGYKAPNIFEEIVVFRRIPITPQLTTEDLFNAIWDVEAILNSLFTVASLGWHRHSTSEKSSQDGQ